MPGVAPFIPSFTDAEDRAQRHASRPPWWHNPPESPLEIAAKLEERMHFLRSSNEEGQALRRLLKTLKGHYSKTLQEVKLLFPLAFFKPSYEQSLLLNCWIWGINFPVCFSANRIGKTTGFLINLLLWIYPNDPSWLVFQPYTDHLGRRVHVVPRPRLDAIIELQKFLRQNPHLYGNPNLPYDDLESGNAEKVATLQLECPGYYRPSYPKPPIRTNCEFWLGAPDNDWHRHIMMKRLTQWLPKNNIEKISDQERYFVINTNSDTNPISTRHTIVCKSYESKDEKWSGDAVAGIILSEGFTKEILDEVKQRLTEHSFASWDYTPTEARNVGSKVQLAYKVYKGKEELPLRTHVFTGFSARNAPNHIIPQSKREDMIRMWAGRPEGTARLDGNFFASSKALLDSLNKDHHCLPWTWQYLRELYPTAPLFRGFDAGFDHPSVCVWALLSPNNVWFVYRVWSKRGETIGARCKQIIELSNNSREKVKFGPGPDDFYYRETHPNPDSEPILATIADFHIFKTDEASGQPYVNTYTMQGLVLTESTHLAPEPRVLDLNKLLDPMNNVYSPHPISGRPPSSKVYFLINEPGVAQMLDQFDNLFWDRYKAGEHKGESKDKVPIHGDDELDALCYLTSSPFRYREGMEGQRRLPLDSEPEPYLQEAKSNRNRNKGGLLPADYSITTQRQNELSNPLQPVTSIISSGAGRFGS